MSLNSLMRRVPSKTEGVIELEQYLYCFGENDEPDCSEEMFLTKYREEKVRFISGEPTFHELIASDVVFSGRGERARCCG